MREVFETAGQDTAKIFSDFAASLTFEDIPGDVAETARLFIADYYAACFAGRFVNRRFNAALEQILTNMGGKEEASAFGLDRKLPAENAAFLNAAYAHGADMDDGNRKAMGHIAAHVLSAVFALAESLGDRTWKDVITAMIVGYECYNRISAMAQPGLVHRGFHSTGTAGALACGAACARLLGLDARGICSAIAISTTQASGLMSITESGQACKPLNPANAARVGILSAKLAAAGVEGPDLPLESRQGWFRAMTDEVHYGMLDGLGEQFTICESYLKPYPSCRHTHCGIEAALELRNELQETKRAIGDIRRLTLHIYGNAIRIAGQIRIPRTPDDAKFSIHYSLVVALLTGGYTLQDLERGPTAEERALAEKLELIRDDSLEEAASGIRGARLCAELADGSRIERTVLLPKGDAANPFTWDDMQRKLAACMQDENGLAEHVTARVRALDPEERFGSVRDLLA